MKKLLLLSIALLSVLMGSCQALDIDKSLWYGTIDFPSNTSIVPPIRVYYAGKKIQSSPDQEAKEVSFIISEYKMRNSFYLVICDEIDFVSEQNTIKYLRVPANRPYKLFSLTFKPNTELDVTQMKDADLGQKGTWQIEQMALPDDRRMPDDAIAVCYHPYLVKTVIGGNALELPKIVLDEHALEKLTPQELHDTSIHFLLSSLNCDSFHEKTYARYNVKNNTISLLLS